MTFDVADVVLEVLIGVLDHTDLSVPVDEVSKETLVSYAKEFHSSILRPAERCRLIALTPVPSDSLGRPHQVASLVPGDETWYWLVALRVQYPMWCRAEMCSV